MLLPIANLSVDTKLVFFALVCPLLAVACATSPEDLARAKYIDADRALLRDLQAIPLASVAGMSLVSPPTLSPVLLERDGAIVLDAVGYRRNWPLFLFQHLPADDNFSVRIAVPWRMAGADAGTDQMRLDDLLSDLRHADCQVHSKAKLPCTHGFGIAIAGDETFATAARLLSSAGVSAGFEDPYFLLRSQGALVALHHRNPGFCGSRQSPVDACMVVYAILGDETTSFGYSQMPDGCWTDDEWLDFSERTSDPTSCQQIATQATAESSGRLLLAALPESNCRRFFVGASASVRWEFVANFISTITADEHVDGVGFLRYACGTKDVFLE